MLRIVPLVVKEIFKTVHKDDKMVALMLAVGVSAAMEAAIEGD